MFHICATTKTFDFDPVGMALPSAGRVFFFFSCHFFCTYALDNLVRVCICMCFGYEINL